MTSECCVYAFKDRNPILIAKVAFDSQADREACIGIWTESTPEFLDDQQKPCFLSSINCLPLDKSKNTLPYHLYEIVSIPIVPIHLVTLYSLNLGER